MKKIIGIVLIALSLFIGYQGVQQMESSKKSLKIGELEISASDESEKSNAYVYLGGGLLLLVGGVYLVGQKNN